MTPQPVWSSASRSCDVSTPVRLTSKRLLCNGRAKNVAAPFKRVIHFTLYGTVCRSRRMLDETMYFLGNGNVQFLRVTLEA
jgi:hypothetical protein